MLKLTLNRVRIDLRIEPVTPLLIKTGDKGAAMLHPERPDLMFVRTGTRASETVYIPGSSIKGVVRSAAERILRTVEVACCDPLDDKGKCHFEAGKKGDEIARRNPREAKEEHPQAAVYKLVCFACRTFGSQAIAARALFEDAYPPEGIDLQHANATERRNGVSISRTTGGPERGKLFDMEVVTRGAFHTSLHLTNVQLWQVGLIGLVLRDIDVGFVRFGSAKSRGLGHVRLVPRVATFEQIDPGRSASSPSGVGALREDLVKPYDLRAATSDKLENAAGATEGTFSIGRRWAWSNPEQVWAFLDACAGKPWEDFCADRARGRQ